MLGPIESGMAYRYSEAQDSSKAPSYETPVARQVQVMGGSLLAPLVLSVGRTEDQVLVSDELLRVYGVGDDLEGAVADLLEMLNDYHSELSESKQELSGHLAGQLRILDYYLGHPC